jgi:hypothetical protein
VVDFVNTTMNLSLPFLSNWGLGMHCVTVYVGA